MPGDRHGRRGSRRPELLTTGDHLFHTLAIGYWPVAGFDLTLLVTAALALVAARRLGRQGDARVRVGGSDRSRMSHA